MITNKHSILGPSAAHRWTKCPGSVRLSQKATYRKSNPHAEEGTAAHQLAERCLRENLEPSEFLGVEFNGFIADEEMVDAVKLYVDYIRKKFKRIKKSNPKAELLIEERVEMPQIHKEIFGTADAIIRSKKKIWVIDFKYGQHCLVEVKNNPQPLLYGLGAQHKFGKAITQIECTIVQPRMKHIDGPIRTVAYSKQKLEKKAKWLTEKASLSDRPNAPLVAGDHCTETFCPAMGICSKLYDLSQSVAKRAFKESDLNLPRPAEMTPQQQNEVLRHRKVIKKWFDTVEEHRIQECLKSMGSVHGYKAVPGRGKGRQWIEPILAELTLVNAGLSDDEILASRSLKSPAQLEKKIGRAKAKEVFAGLVHNPPGKMKLIEIGASFPSLPETE